MTEDTKLNIRNQTIALSLTVITCAFLVFLLWLEVMFINRFNSEDIHVHIRPEDVIVGMVIYLKTAIDFAIYIGRLMEKNQGLKGRIGIEIGTAMGNAAGTFGILLIWSLFKEVNWLLALMIIVAGLVLIRLAEDSLQHVDPNKPSYPPWFRSTVITFDRVLKKFNGFLGPVLNKVLPSHAMKVEHKKTLWALLAMSFTVPFILGLDDFAGYVPLFNIVNVFGFATGVFVGHMVLNIFLYISPSKTIKAVKNPIISFAGAAIFVLLALWGFREAFELLFVHGH